jgi:hypothetical protein
MQSSLPVSMNTLGYLMRSSMCSLQGRIIKALPISHHLLHLQDGQPETVERVAAAFLRHGESELNRAWQHACKLILNRAPVENIKR